jgi:hypothetical protein
MTGARSARARTRGQKPLVQIDLYKLVAFRDPRLAGKSAATATPAAGGGGRLHQ